MPRRVGRRGYLTVVLDGKSLAGSSVLIGRPFIRPFPPWKWPSLPGRVCSSTLTGRYRIMRKPFGFGSRNGVSRFARVWAGKGITQAFAGAESFFNTLTGELETLDGNHLAGDVRESVFMYLEAYDNRVRIHSILDYGAPKVFNSGQVA
jgi:hypothetical protein